MYLYNVSDGAMSFSVPSSSGWGPRVVLMTPFLFLSILIVISYCCIKVGDGLQRRQ